MAGGANPNVIVVACPKCGKSYRVPASAAGKRAKCVGCGESMEVPAARPPEEPVLMETPPTYETEVRQDPSAATRAAANLAEAIRQRKEAKKQKKVVIFILAAVGVVIVVISAWFLPSGPPDKTAAGVTPPVTSAPPATEAPETTQLIADLASADNAVRSSAASKLGERPDQASFAVPALKRALDSEQNAEVRTEIEKSLKRLPGQ